MMNTENNRFLRHRRVFTVEYFSKIITSIRLATGKISTIVLNGRIYVSHVKIGEPRSLAYEKETTLTTGND